MNDIITKKNESIEEQEKIELICADFEPDCAEVNDPIACKAGGVGQMPCCGRLIFLEPVKGICPMIGKLL